MFQKSLKKYCNISGDLNWQFWNKSKIVKPKKQGKQDTVTQEHGDPGLTCDQKERDRTGKAGGGGHRTRVSKIVL